VLLVTRLDRLAREQFDQPGFEPRLADGLYRHDTALSDRLIRGAKI
jgi:hypothetical protein